ncbi:uncharacterized protein TNCT_247981 [Trichonephila clavata]|uniref:Uncharacterized protein n=1 Tax=Trichonephila clavata TaxID=2740835 RepID=A0A8X6GCY7_TRICU|nr:uncharacterized protein TNCT_247981 [Trichonephila clavata]
MKTAPFVRSHSNVPPKCYYFNVIEINETLSQNIRKEDFSTGIELHLRNILLPDSGSRLDVEFGTGQISVHSRNNFNNPFLTGMSVQKGKNVILRVKQVLKKSLPYPYETDCHDYVSEIEERSSPGPTNQMECIEQCKLNLSLLNHNCVLESIWYPHNFQRCRPVNQLQLLGEYHEKCAPQCHEACSEMTYEVQKDEEYIPVTFDLEIDFDSPFMTEVVLKRNRRVDISIVFNRDNCHIHEKQPKYNIVEVMSNIGGFLGMWMGVSMIAILNLFEIILTIFFFCIKRKKSKKISKVVNIV